MSPKQLVCDHLARTRTDTSAFPGDRYVVVVVQHVVGSELLTIRTCKRNRSPSQERDLRFGGHAKLMCANIVVNVTGRVSAASTGGGG